MIEGHRIIHLLVPIDPDLVVETGEGGLDVPIPPVSDDDLGIVENIPQAEHGTGTRLTFLEPGKRRQYLALESERFLVDDEKIGFKGLRGGQDNVGPDGEGLLVFDLDGE
ncbi:MAG: hypothetical protein P8X86_12200 [Desulfofustis sp.]